MKIKKAIELVELRSSQSDERLGMEIVPYKKRRATMASLQGEIKTRDHDIEKLKGQNQSLADQNKHLQRICSNRLFDIIKEKRSNLDLKVQNIVSNFEVRKHLFTSRIFIGVSIVLCFYIGYLLV